MTFPSFEEYFEACHGVAPYRWQSRLSQQVLDHGRWPDALDLPTGAGKTSAIDIAIHAMAHASHHGEPGRFPRRVFLVVDRRVLVDQAWRWGAHAFERIRTVPALAPMQQALLALGPDEPVSLRLRGACPTDRRWAAAPDQVLVVATTVDQLGSRLLMRGYGVSATMKPIEAGLVGQDALLLLDEAHLSGPLLDTLSRLAELEPVRGLPVRWQAVQLSATLAREDCERFALVPGEDDQDQSLMARMNAHKSIRWLDSKRIDKACADVDARCLLVVANTVPRAIEAHQQLSAASKSNERRRELFLITGRMRPVDREIVLQAIEQRLESREPTLVVATQCIEAGVDWDFDALVTECASWDALVQRMGRVNRAGAVESGQVVVIPASRTHKAPKGSELAALGKLCPVYQQFELRTAEWLANQEQLAVTTGDMPTPPAECVRPPATAPILIPEYLDHWSQTRSEGDSFDVSAFLHGTTENRQVQVIWRDIDSTDPTLRDQLRALPPSSLEASPAPLAAVRDWLGSRSPRVLGRDLTSRTPSALVPGDTLIVPCNWGGLGDHGTFDGRSTGPVDSVAAEALAQHRNLRFEYVDAPEGLDESLPLEGQVSEWVAGQPDRDHLRGWRWVDAGSRWLFVSHLPIDLGDDDGSSFRRAPVSLESHLSGVRQRTLEAARRLGLPAVLAGDLALAAHLHDLGKLDDRFQRVLGRRDGESALAKSALGPRGNDRQSRLSDYPTGERHEALSVSLARQHGLLGGAQDEELVEHLMASHHGWARPFIREAQGSAPVQGEMLGRDFTGDVVHDEAVRAPDRFERLQGRYGWLGLAWLESIVRLCDHRQSEAEDNGEAGGSLESFPAGVDASRVEAIGDRASQHVMLLPALNGSVPGDFLSALGILKGLSLAGLPARLSWRGTAPCIEGPSEIEELAAVLVQVRQDLGDMPAWPAPLNKMDEAGRVDLLLGAEHPLREWVTAFVHQGGRSQLDFVSGGKGTFTEMFAWLMGTPEANLFSLEALQSSLRGHRQLVKKGKSLRWTALAAQGAQRPQRASADNRTEPWIEWLALLGATACLCVPIDRNGSLWAAPSMISRSPKGTVLLHWPLWRQPRSWQVMRWMMASPRVSATEVTWFEAERLEFGTKTNRQYALTAGRRLDSRQAGPQQAMQATRL